MALITSILVRVYLSDSNQYLRLLVRVAGYDPAISSIRGRRITRLSYTLLLLVRSRGFEPPLLLGTATSRQRVYQFRHDRISSKCVLCSVRRLGFEPRILLYPKQADYQTFPTPDGTQLTH